MYIYRERERVREKNLRKKERKKEKRKKERKRYVYMHRSLNRCMYIPKRIYILYYI